MHITLCYYGDKFLGLYTLLRNPDRTKHIFQWLRDNITILHWNIKLTSLDRYGRGHLSAGDQKVLSLDDRVHVPWQLPTERKEHSNQRCAPGRVFLRPLPRGLLRRPLTVSPLQSEAIANNRQKCGKHEVLACSRGKHKNSYYNN